MPWLQPQCLLMIMNHNVDGNMDLKDGEPDKNHPTIPNEIVDAINTNSLVVFIGAGLSGLFHLPLWNHLALQMLDEIHEERIDGKRIISHSTRNSLRSESNDPRRLLSIIYEMCDDKTVFHSHLKSKLSINPNGNVPNDTSGTDDCLAKPRELVRILERWNSSVITTNYDTILDELLHGYIVFDSGNDVNVPEGGFSKPYLVHIHGSIKKPESMIITVSQYYQMYHGSEDWKTTRDFLRKVFGTSTILFIGYGMRDYELLEYAQSSGRKDAYFLLEPHTKLDEVVIEPLKRYYDSVNVRMIPYFIDEDGYITILDVLSRWENELNLLSRIPADRCEEIDMLISKEPDDAGRIRISTLIEYENYLRYFINKIEGTTHETEWIKALSQAHALYPNVILKYIREGKTSTASILMTNLSRVLKKNRDDEFLRETARDVVQHVMDSTIKGKIDSNDYIIHRRCMQMIVILMDDLGESVMDYLELASSLDEDGSTVIDTISEDVDSFLELKNLSKVALLRYSLTHSLTVKTVSDGYWAQLLYESLKGKLDQPVLDDLFDYLNHHFIEYTDEEPYAGSEIGSIKEYLSRDSHYDREYCLLKWICSVVGDLSGDKLETFVKNNLNSRHHLRKTMAQYVINVHFNELQALFWQIDDYSNLNYSELYDTVKNNVQYFDHSNVRSFVDTVIRSFENLGPDPDFARAYRYSLLKLMPCGFIEVESALNDNRVEDEMQYRKPEDRGKLIMFSSTWGSEENNPVEYTSLSEVLDAIHSENLSYQERRAVETYLEKNSDELVKQPEAIEDIPCVLYNTISRGMEICGGDSEEIFRIYSRIIHATIDRNPDYLQDCLFHFKRWSKNNNFEGRLSEVLVDVAERNVELFCTKDIVEMDDKLIESANNWFTGILWALLNDLNYEAVKPYSSRIVQVLNDVMENASTEGRLLVRLLVAFRWYTAVLFDKDWTKTNYMDILCNHESYWPTAMFLLNSYFDKEIYDSMIKSGKLNEILDVRSKNTNIIQAIVSVGASATFAYSKYKDIDYLQIIRNGASSHNYSYVIQGILSQLIHDYAEDETSETIMSQTIEYVNGNPEGFHHTPILADFIKQGNGSMKTKLRLANSLISKSEHVVSRFYDVLREEAVECQETVDIALNIANQNLMYYCESYELLIRELACKSPDKNKVREICNILGNRGLDVYYQIEREMDRL